MGLPVPSCHSWDTDSMLCERNSVRQHLLDCVSMHIRLSATATAGTPPECAIVGQITMHGLSVHENLAATEKLFSKLRRH